MDNNWSNVIQCFLICACIVGSIFSFSSCVARETEAQEKTKQSYGLLERCIESCPVGWVKDKNCVNKCLELEEKRTTALNSDYEASLPLVATPKDFPSENPIS